MRNRSAYLAAAVMLLLCTSAMADGPSAALPVQGASGFQLGEDSDWLRREVPFFECPDASIDEIYYFRWRVYHKHLKQTPDGFVVTEFLPNVDWAGKHNTISCAAGHHFREGRWLHDTRFLEDYARFWFRKGGEPRRYSFWAADSVVAFCLATGNTALLTGALAGPDPELPGVGENPSRLERSLLADRRPRRHGILAGGQRLPADDQLVSVWRCNGHRAGCRYSRSVGRRRPLQAEGPGNQAAGSRPAVGQGCSILQNAAARRGQEIGGRARAGGIRALVLQPA